MVEDNYYVFADSEGLDEDGLPKLHVRTYKRKVNVNIHDGWIATASHLRARYADTRILPDYKIPNELKQLNSLRELSKNEIGILEAAILGCPFKN